MPLDERSRAPGMAEYAEGPPPAMSCIFVYEIPSTDFEDVSCLQTGQSRPVRPEPRK